MIDTLTDNCDLARNKYASDYPNGAQPGDAFQEGNFVFLTNVNGTLAIYNTTGELREVDEWPLSIDETEDYEFALRECALDDDEAPFPTLDDSFRDGRVIYLRDADSALGSCELDPPPGGYIDDDQPVRRSDGKEYASITEAAKETGCDPQEIRAACEAAKFDDEDAAEAAELDPNDEQAYYDLALAAYFRRDPDADQPCENLTVSDGNLVYFRNVNGLLAVYHVDSAVREIPEENWPIAAFGTLEEKGDQIRKTVAELNAEKPKNAPAGWVWSMLMEKYGEEEMKGLILEQARHDLTAKK